MRLLSNGRSLSAAPCATWRAGCVSFVDSVEKQTEGRFTSETAAGESDSETDEELGTGVSPKCVFLRVHRLASKGIQEAVSKPTFTFGCQKKGIPSSSM